LLSVSKITDRKYKVLISKEKAAIIDKCGSEKLVERRVNNLYYEKGMVSNKKTNNSRSLPLVNLASKDGPFKLS